jgi:hypothetical protein
MRHYGDPLSNDPSGHHQTATVARG